MSLFGKNIITESMEEAAEWEKSPTAQGLIEGIKAGLMAAPIGGSVQGLRGKNIVSGAVGTGLATGLLVGGLAAAVQKLKNLRAEADLRYHARNMISREPSVFVPPRSLPPYMLTDPSMGGTFTQGINNVYRPY